ncbi:amino acid ABC transporter permease [Metaclostridioides mangenotii]|jgi:putative amino-acid transport system permease protein|uniref:Amino-acid transport system permease protein n=3 Tax=Metaclostridioides mangenotii TaxID=1540 RepID=A0ABS4EBZ9_9FIRM|nr:putative amino-acid transport system permease protein [Clostridioides mangenotii]
MIKLIPTMLKYSGVTLKLSILAVFFGLMIAFIIALLTVAKTPVLSTFFKFYISFFRGTPLIAQLFCLYFGVIPIIRNIIQVDSFHAALIILSLASSAYMAESLRAAILSINKGQMEAANSIGMTYIQSMFYIILPQAIKVAIPTLFSSFINIVKDTSLVFAIGVKEMMAQAQLEGSSGYRYLEAYVCVLLVYWGITAIMGKFQKHLEIRLGSR